MALLVEHLIHINSYRIDFGWNCKYKIGQNRSTKMVILNGILECRMFREQNEGSYAIKGDIKIFEDKSRNFLYSKYALKIYIYILVSIFKNIFKYVNIWILIYVFVRTECSREELFYIFLYVIGLNATFKSCYIYELSTAVI